MEKYSHVYTVTAADMDNCYRITPHAILLYFQDCFARYMGCLHLAAFDLVKEQKMWIITEFAAEMPDIETFWTEDVEVTMWISEISALRTYSDYCIKKAGTDIVIAKGTSCWCLMNTETRKLETTASIAPKITVLPEIMIAHKKVRFPNDGELLKSENHKVNLLDLDFNGHVNNRSYLNIAMLTATEDFLESYRMRSLVIHWLHETYLDDTLHCDLLSVGDGNFLYLLRNNKGVVAAEIFSRWSPLVNSADISSVIKRQ